MANFDQNKWPFWGANLEGDFATNMPYGAILTYLKPVKDFCSFTGQKGSIVKLSLPSSLATQLTTLAQGTLFIRVKYPDLRSDAKLK